MDFPITDLLDEQACYERLEALLHPGGLACPRCGARAGLGVHRRHRAPVLDYQCGACSRVFNAFTGTALQKSRRPCAQVLLILRGLCRGGPPPPWPASWAATASTCWNSATPGRPRPSGWPSGRCR
jgi:hypothetical protein